jgi:predicted ATPase/DNA-binding winged helix-turn-helix (wHTH) protein
VSTLSTVSTVYRLPRKNARISNVMERTALFGRAEELFRLSELIVQHELVTLVGPGGIGKTRLALAAAKHAESAFPGGVFVVELAGSTAHDDIDSLVARQLGINSLEAIHYRSRDRPILVVLDNCESAIRPAARLALRLMNGSRGIRVLATSRVPLGEPNEHLVPVRPLETPIDGDVRSSRTCASVQLFFECAERAGADLQTTDEVVNEVTQLVKRLDGMPLAIELAAARMRVLSPGQLLERLGDHLDLLHRPGDETDRHHSIRAAIMTSYEPLAPAAKQAFRRLSVVPAPFDISLAHAVCSDDSPAVIEERITVELLAVLIDTSLVESSTSTGSLMCYRLLEPVRLFGIELLEHSGELAKTTERYVNAMVTFATDIAAAALNEFRFDVLDRMRAHYAHLFHALDWCMANDSTADRANRLFLPLFGHSLPETVARARRARATWVQPAPLHAEVLAIMGAVAMHAGARALSQQWSDEAIASAGDSELAQMIARRTLGYLAAYSGDRVSAQRHLEEAALIGARFSGSFAREIGLSRAALMTDPSEIETGLALTAEIAHVAEERGELVTVHWASVIATSLLVLRGQLDDAMEMAARAQTLAERTGHMWSTSASHRSVASVVAARDGWNEAMPHFRRALDSSLLLGDLAGASITIRAAAGALQRSGDFDSARRLWGAIVDPAARSIVASVFAKEECELEKHRYLRAPSDVASAVGVAREMLRSEPGPRSEETSNVVIHFGSFELDPGLYELRDNGVRVHLEPKVFDVLMYLANRRGLLVSKEELIDNVWGGQFVTESALTTRIKAARRATGDNGSTQLVIRTVHGRGYTFVADGR